MKILATSGRENVSGARPKELLRASGPRRRSPARAPVSPNSDPSPLVPGPPSAGRVTDAPPMPRIQVPAADRILGVKHPVLSHGYVVLVDYMGDDSSIVQA